MDFELEGKTVVVTGGSKGIGFATAMTFLQEGAKVAICARREEELTEEYIVPSVFNEKVSLAVAEAVKKQ